MNSMVLGVVATRNPRRNVLQIPCNGVYLPSDEFWEFSDMGESNTHQEKGHIKYNQKLNSSNGRPGFRWTSICTARFMQKNFPGRANEVQPRFIDLMFGLEMWESDLATTRLNRRWKFKYARLQKSILNKEAPREASAELSLPTHTLNGYRVFSGNVIHCILKCDFDGLKSQWTKLSV